MSFISTQIKLATGLILIGIIFTGYLGYTTKNNKTKDNNIEFQNNIGQIKSSSAKESPNTKPIITTTFYPVEFLTSGITGESYNVVSIIPKSSDPHTYQPTPQDLDSIANSEMFVYMGGNIDGQFEDMINAKLPNNKLPVYAINYGVDMIIPLESISETEFIAPENKIQNQIQTKPIGSLNPFKNINAQAHSLDAGNPHTWLEPKRMIIFVDKLTARLTDLFPENKSLFEKNATSLRSKLKLLDDKFTIGLSECRLNYVLLGGEEMEHLAKSYGFKVVKYEDIEPADQLSYRKFNQQTDTIKADELKYIFGNDDKVENLLSKQSGTSLIKFDSMENILPGQDYFTIMESNLKNIETARVCG